MGLASMPTVIVEIAFASDPGDEAPTWTSVSADVISVEYQRGRNRELTRDSAGTASVVLLDTARKYDPQNAAGPYFGDLLPMKRLRVRATYNTVTYDRWAGYIESFEHEYEGPNGATVRIAASDAFLVLEAATLQTSAYAQEVANDGPVAWWRLGEADDTTKAYDSIGSYDLDRTGTLTFGEAGLVSRETDTAVAILDSGASNPENGLDFLGPKPLDGSPLSVELLFKCASDPGATRNLFVLVSPDLTLGIQVGTQSSEYVVGVAVSGASLVLTSTTAVVVGETVHLLVTWDGAGQLVLYVNGVVENYGYIGTLVLPDTTYTAIGGATLVINQAGPADGIYDEVALYDAALSATQAAAHAETVATPWNGDTPGERITRVLDSVTFPVALRDLDDGTSVLQSASLATTALDHIQKAADSDFGRLFISSVGKVRFLGRAGLYNRPSLATFGDDKTDPTELGYRKMRPEFTGANIRNDVTVSRVEGVAQTATDQTSIDSFLRHSFSVDGLIHNSDLLSRSAAEFFLSEYKDPLRRVAELLHFPRGDLSTAGSRPQDLFPAVLARELAEVVTVIDRPPGGGALNQQDVEIEGISERITPQWWETSWYLSPAFGSAVAGFEVGVWDETDWNESRWAV